MWLVRPYPVARIPDARRAIEAAASGDLRPMQALYRAAASALAELDPDDLAMWQDDHPDAARSDGAATRAAELVCDAWEGIVGVGATITDQIRFRAFAWLAADRRFELTSEKVAPAELFARYAEGDELPDTSPEDAALYVALSALVGLGPELPDELEGDCPFQGDRVGALLGLPGEDWDEVDPLDAIAVRPEQCRAAFAGVPAAWRDVVGRSLESGLIIRRG